MCDNKTVKTIGYKGKTQVLNLFCNCVCRYYNNELDKFILDLSDKYCYSLKVWDKVRLRNVPYKKLVNMYKKMKELEFSYMKRMLQSKLS